MLTLDCCELSTGDIYVKNANEIGGELKKHAQVIKSSTAEV